MGVKVHDNRLFPARKGLPDNNQLVLIGVFYEPYNAVGFGFTEDVLAMGFNRSFTDEQSFGNLFITVFLLNKADNFQLPVC